MTPRVTYDRFVFDEIRQIGRAWRSKNPESFPDHVTDGQIAHMFEKIGDMSWRRLVGAATETPGGKSLRQIYEEIGVNPNDFLPDVPDVPAGKARRGLVRAEGQAIIDDDGAFHPFGLTLFWSVYGHLFEQDRIAEHETWLNRFTLDYTRKLCEVDWDGRSWGPSTPGYQNALAASIDSDYEQGRRSQLTLIGGRTGNEIGMRVAEVVAEVVNDNRAHKIQYLEVVNEWKQGNPDKMSRAPMVRVGRFLRDHTPCLVALSCPTNTEDEDDNTSYEEMMAINDEAGATVVVLHPRRKDHDRKWAQIRQAYDCANFDIATCIQEGVGPQSSVKTNDSPLQLGLMRLLTGLCGGFYTQHVGQGVTGIASPSHGRPQNMWEVPNIEPLLQVVGGVGALLPERVENWKVVNNRRGDHPLKLDSKTGFWKGSGPGSVNKNYAAISGDQFRIALLGVKAVHDGDQVLVGKATRRCHVEAIDPVTKAVVETADLAVGDPWALPGRVDTQVGYWIVGQYR